MNNDNRITISSLLNLLFAFCLLRFGLVFTAGMGIFGLPYIVVLGGGIVLIYMFLSKQYAGQVLRTNVVFLGINILLVALFEAYAPSASYRPVAANYVNQLIVLLLLWGFYLRLRSMKIRSQRRLTILYLTAIVISSVYTLYVALTRGPRAIRNTAFGAYDSGVPLMYGGFDFIYALVLVYGVLLTVLVYGKSRITQSTSICIVLLLLVVAATVITSGFSTAFVLILVFTILNVFQKKSVKVLWLGIVLILLFVIPEEVAAMIKRIPFMPEITSGRLGELILSFAGKGTSSYVGEEGQRVDRMLWSLKAFAENPLLGAFASGNMEKIGHHTEWIDQLARYGIFTAIFNALFWVRTYWIMVRETKNAPLSHKCIQNAFVLYFVLGFLNPISMVVTAAPLFVLCPFVEKLFLADNKRQQYVSKQD